MKSERLFTVDSDGGMKEYEKPYATIDCETEKDFKELMGLVENNKRLSKIVEWIKEQYEDDFTEEELNNLCPRDESIYNTVKKII